jgi:hypothetical protein
VERALAKLGVSTADLKSLASGHSSPAPPTCWPHWGDDPLALVGSPATFAGFHNEGDGAGDEVLWSRSTLDAALGSGAGESLLEAVEECAPTLGGVFVLLGRHRAALLEEHLGATVAEVGEYDGHELERVVARLI